MLRNPPNHNAGNPLRILNEVLSLNAQEWLQTPECLRFFVLNEVLSLNAQELRGIRGRVVVRLFSSMKS